MLKILYLKEIQISPTLSLRQHFVATSLILHAIEIQAAISHMDLKNFVLYLRTLDSLKKLRKLTLNTLINGLQTSLQIIRQPSANSMNKLEPASTIRTAILLMVIKKKDNFLRISKASWRIPEAVKSILTIAVVKEINSSSTCNNTWWSHSTCNLMWCNICWINNKIAWKIYAINSLKMVVKMIISSRQLAISRH